MQARGVFNLASLVLLLTVSISARADEYDQAATDLRCAQVAQIVPPPGDLPTPAQRQALAGCDAEGLYFGIGRTPDPVQARLCAFVQQGKETSSQPYGFSGSHMLMVIYANGLGATRNIHYAMHLACTSSEAPMERYLRVAHLLGHRESWYTDQFRFCDDSTSSLTGGYCAAHFRRLTQQGQRAAIVTYSTSLPMPVRPAFMALSRAQAIWSEVRSSHEVDLTGTMRAALEIDEEDLQDRDFIAMLDRLHAGHPPRLGVADLTAADARVQQTLDHIERESNYLHMGTVTRDDVAMTQYAWENYRDAWGAFADQAYPAWGAAGAKAWVTLKRADMLAHLHRP